MSLHLRIDGLFLADDAVRLFFDDVEECSNGLVDLRLGVLCCLYEFVELLADDQQFLNLSCNALCHQLARQAYLQQRQTTRSLTVEVMFALLQLVLPVDKVALLLLFFGDFLVQRLLLAE